MSVSYMDDAMDGQIGGAFALLRNSFQCEIIEYQHLKPKDLTGRQDMNTDSNFYGQ